MLDSPGMPRRTPGLAPGSPAATRPQQRQRPQWRRARRRRGEEAMPGEPVAGELRLAAAVPSEPAGHAAERALASRNGANAPADSPEEADTLPARGLRPDLLRRGDAAAPVDAAAGEAAADEAAESAPGEGSRGTPGMSQPGSVIARLPPPGQLAYFNRSHIRLYCPPVTFLDPLFVGWWVTWAALRHRRRPGQEPLSWPAACGGRHMRRAAISAA